MNMSRVQFLWLCAAVACLHLAVAITQGVKETNAPRTRFTCQGRASGYYADVETGCQVYHMCDGLGRQFSYSCPNTTLFQQRMLICDHWYMVNCSKSESDYSANLLIGQRDKPFVSEEDMKQRTPRPDILSVPPNANYYDGLREAETRYPVHPGNSIVGIADSISSSNNNGLDSAKQNYRPPTGWSTGTGVQFGLKRDPTDQDHLAGAASQELTPTFQPTPEVQDDNQNNKIPTPSKYFQPPIPDTTTTEYPDIDIRTKSDDPVYKFIKRFDPSSPDSIKTAMSRSEIIDLNKHLPEGQVSSEEDRTPRKNKDVGNFNKLDKDNDKGVTEGTRFDSINSKPTPTEPTVSVRDNPAVPTPDRILLPPKLDFSEQPSTTMGPPVYYEWKWAVPAFDLEPPKESNVTVNNTQVQGKTVRGRSPFSDVTRPTPVTVDPTPSNINTEYNISSYFVPDYVFPLDKPHPGYEDENAQTSFQVKIARTGRSSYGENPACPQCHPAYLEPGTCEPCIVNR
ncbi:uncharacterized protein LOC114358330 isoform X1 [Ostrinia furnacalis]|uniref:uncharacterized protein LOC114358330 isoform X1 n=1 Tax=Ostrinia furnacalis TaxID=93504 RepID=UPI001038AF6A|nr:uncharacterized protein LOC114358330 isoform X1 [Ostrinia furnacalis]XP_028168065.1 uncharacterized protein LOC114358330 isoform X1 [Ostrinia furnacalis]